MMEIFSVIAGLVLLVAGRKLFWFFIAVAGFFVGMEFAEVVLVGAPAWAAILAGLGAGLLGALLAVVAERLAFALAGFYAGGYLTLVVLQALWSVAGGALFLFVLGGVAGAVVAVLVMDWAIIVFSSLVGAGVAVTALAVPPGVGAALFGGLTVAGILLQARFRGSRGQPPAPPPAGDRPG